LLRGLPPLLKGVNFVFTVSKVGTSMFEFGVCIMSICIFARIGGLLGEWLAKNWADKPFFCFGCVLSLVGVLIAIIDIVLYKVFGIDVIW
jgi:CBS domain containing-hemolysin-like protein